MTCGINNEESYWNEKFNQEFHLLQNYYSYLSELVAQPSVLYSPRIFKDGDKWYALYGTNIQDGVCGFGKTPAEAIKNFNKEWNGEEVSE